MRAAAFAVLAGLIAAAIGHPGEDAKLSVSEVSRKREAAEKRHVQARTTCGGSISAYHAARKAKRSPLSKRSHVDIDDTAIVPHYSAIKNYTCVTAPEVTEGPYYINDEIVRQDLTDGQPGIKLIIDVGVLDITTCEPLEDAIVELWTANATGAYSSYSSAGGPPGGPPGHPPGRHPGGPRKRPPKGPHRGHPGGPGSGPPRGSPSMTANETFLRGGWPTDEDGVAEMTLIYPGHYAGRATHIHTMVHVNWAMNDNGTLISHAGSVVHIGQFFFDEDWNDKVYAFAPYTLNTRRRVRNEEDGIFLEENADGNNAIIDLEMIGDNIEDGLLGFVTMGVNSSNSFDIHNTNYLNSSTTGAADDSTVSGDHVGDDGQVVLGETIQP